MRREFFAERETHDESKDVYTEIHKSKMRSAVTKLCGKLTSIRGAKMPNAIREKHKHKGDQLKCRINLT
jgi:hypothetical protein